MPALQLRGFLIALFSVVAMLGVATVDSHSATAEPIAIKAKKAKPVAKPTIAVLYFDYSGNDEEMGFLRKGMAQMLVTDLSASNTLQIVERIDLEAVLSELKLNRSNKIDKASRNRIGKLLGARYLVTGGYFQFGKTLRVDAKIIDVERGTTTSVGAQATPADFMKIEGQLASKLEAALLKVHKLRAPKRPKHARRTHKHAAKVSAQTVARYGRALDAIDRGKTKIAATELGAITRDAPEFKPAANELRVLLR